MGMPMRKAFWFLLLFLAAFFRSVATTVPTKPIEVLRSKLLIWNATIPHNFCRGGILESIARNIEVNKGDAKEILDTINQFVPTKDNRRSLEASQEEDDQNMSDLEMKTDRDAYLTSVYDAVKKMGYDEASIKESLDYARTDYDVTTRMFSPLSHGLLERILKKLSSSQLDASVQRLLNKDSETLEGSSLNSTEAQRRRLFSWMEIGTIAPKIAEKIKRMIMPYLGTTAMAEFVRQLFLPASGDQTSGTPSNSLHSTMTNVGTVICKSVEYGILEEKLPVATSCGLLNAFQSALACRPEVWTRKNYCAKKPKTWLPRSNYCGVGSNKLWLDGSMEVVFNMTDLRPIPPTILPEQFKGEGITAFLLFRAQWVVSVYELHTYPCRGSIPDEDLVPGWQTTHIFTYVHDGDQHQEQLDIPDVPIGFLAEPRNPSKGNECKRLLAFRPTTSQSEWILNLDAKLVPFLGGGIEAHRGVVRLSNAIWPSIQSAFNDFIDYPCVSPRQLYITGHSLGGAVGILTAMRLAYHYGSWITIHSMTFGSPNVLNEEGVKWFSRRINHRNVQFALDFAGSLPCANVKEGNPRCQGIYDYETGFDKYQENFGKVEIDVNDDKSHRFNSHFLTFTKEASQSGLGIDIDVTFNLPPPLQLPFVHSCAYACILSYYCSDSNINWLCSGCPGMVSEITFSKSIGL